MEHIGFRSLYITKLNHFTLSHCGSRTPLPTGTSLTSLLALGALYCDLEETLKKPIDLITVSSLQQRAQMPSEQDFREAVLNERVKLYDVA